MSWKVTGMPTTNHSGSVLSITEQWRQAICGPGGGTVLAASKRPSKERIGLIPGNLPITDKKSEAKGNKCVGGMCLRCHD
jgi:hypothetical protein